MTGWTPTALLPGLWTALLAVLLGLALRRWFDPVPRRCWIAWSGALLVLFAPALFGGRVLLPLGYLTLLPPFRELWQGEPPGNLIQSDLILQITPWLVRVREAFAAGEWPLWNHLSGAGEPLLGNPQAQALQPLVWLAFPFSAASGAAVTAAWRVLVALVFTYLLLRRQGISEPPALWGSLAYGLAGFLQLWLGWPLANSAVFLPVILYALVLTDQRGLRRDRALLAAAVACVLLVGHPETSLYVVALAAAFAFSLLRSRPAGRRLLLLRAWLAAGLVGGGLAAPAVLAAAGFLPESIRSTVIEERRAQVEAAGPFIGWQTPEERSESASRATARLLPVAAPNAYGNDRFGRYWGANNVNEDAAGFTGTVAFLTFLVACSPLASGRRFPQERLLLAVALVCLVILARPPGLPYLFGIVPVVRQSYNFHTRVLLLLAFAIAYLAACTWERWRQSGLRPIPVALASAAVAALVLWGYLGHPDPEDPSSLATLRYGTMALQLAVLGVSAVLLVWRSGKDQGGRNATLLTWAFALLIGGELLAVHGPANPTVPARLFYPETEPIRFVRERLDSWHRVSGMGGALRANIPSVYGLADPRSSNPAKPAAYMEAIRRINKFPTRATDGFVHADDPLYGLLGVRYVMILARQPLPYPLRPVLRRSSGWVYRRPGALPRLFLPASAARCAEITPFSWSACTAGVEDFAEVAMLRAGPGDQAWRAAAPRDSFLDLLTLRSARLTARARLAEPRLLASSLYQDGGWKLLLDGKPRPTILANGPFVAAWLPAGDFAVDLLYRPWEFVAGVAIAALAVATAAALWIPAPATVRNGRQNACEVR